MAALLSSSFCSNTSDERKFFQYERSPFTSVSMSALNYKPTGRILTLAQPKIRKETTIRDGFSRYVSDPTYSGVPPAAKHARCSERVSELAVPVKYPSYQYELPIPRSVPPGALKYQATTRVNELATPKKILGA